MSVAAYSTFPLRMTGLHDTSRCVKKGVFINLDACVSGCRLTLQKRLTKEPLMLHYSVVFLVIALIAAIFGFGGIAAGAVEIAKILFFIFAIMAIVSFVASLVKKN